MYSWLPYDFSLWCLIAFVILVIILEIEEFVKVAKEELRSLRQEKIKKKLIGKKRFK